MRILKITTHWTPEEADCIYQFLDELKDAIWQHYGEEIVQMHKAMSDEQQAENENCDFNDEIPF